MTFQFNKISWKQTEHGDPYAFWMMSMVAGIDSGSFACFCPCLQQHTKMHTNRQSTGMMAIKSKHKNICICIKNYDMRNRTMTMISPVCMGIVLIITMPQMNSAKEIPLPTLIVHRVRESLESATVFIMLASIGSNEAFIWSLAYSIMVLVCTL